jgi:hypothetical protein
MNIANALKTYSDKGLFAAIGTIIGLDKAQELTIRITSPDSSLFHAVEKRLARTRLIRSANPSSLISEEFSECLIGFTAAMSACYEYLANRSSKAKHFTVYLTYFGSIESSPAYILTIKSTATGNAVLTSLINGVY